MDSIKRSYSVVSECSIGCIVCAVLQLEMSGEFTSQFAANSSDVDGDLPGTTISGTHLLYQSTRKGERWLGTSFYT